jgi:galactose-1-phosphate uridylyltransferase
LCDYAQKEVSKYLAAGKDGERVVVLDEQGGFVAVVPFWATWPFEIMGEFGSPVRLVAYQHADAMRR